ncbi:prepilin peptidase [Maliponia aquimaris]|uniref:Type IV leader peptidase family protein n=1 Tax=Maliponia aquimaris TaxID=1673631 RepID=A0A238KHY2_9RHOB|nr:prepilin peptidase [Maliponia aquimaris]SMX42308.1 Type IV leader peptidase family protein [Maliponia aquimaris]
MSLSAATAAWFLPFVLPICLYICYTDMKGMRIPNHAVVALFAVFAVLGPFVLPFDVYLWRYLHLVVVLVAGIALNAGGAMGAGDAKFAAAAAPLIHIGDLRFLMALFAANLLAAFVAHRMAKFSGLRRLAPDWHSWESGSRFPMGLALGGSLAIYLGLGLVYGS